MREALIAILLFTVLHQPTSTALRSTEALRGSSGRVNFDESFARQRKRLRSWVKSPNKPQNVTGQGIVVAAGGRRLLVNAYVTLKVVRDVLRSGLPVELFYDGLEERDDEVLQLIQGIAGVSIRDLSLLPRPDQLQPWPRSLHGYARKIFSLYSSSFQEVLLLDSDSQPLTRPDELFSLPGYRKHGALFWPDYWRANSAPEAPKARAYAMLGLLEPWHGNEHWASVESGQLLFDRVQHADVLEWVMWINLWSDVMYDYVLGDKDTFEMAFMLSQKHEKFFRMRVPPRSALTAEEGGVLYHVGMVQSIGGAPAFLHRTVRFQPKSGGKFDLAKGVEQHFHPSFFTEPMSVKAARRFVWNTELAMSTMDRSMVNASTPECHQLSRWTQATLRNVLSQRLLTAEAARVVQRYANCKLHHRGEAEPPVSLVPIPWFGRVTTECIKHSFNVFANVRQQLQS